MLPVVKTAISLGLGYLIEYVTKERPLRKWIRARRAKAGKGPLVDSPEADRLADEAARLAADEARKFVP